MLHISPNVLISQAFGFLTLGYVEEFLAPPRQYMKTTIKVSFSQPMKQTFRNRLLKLVD